MAYLPKDYARHESKIVWGLTVRHLITLAIFIALIALVAKASFLNIIIRVVLIFISVALAPLFTFYKTSDGDNLVSYLFNLLVFYSSPKYLIYKRKNNTTKGDDRGV